MDEPNRKTNYFIIYHMLAMVVAMAILASVFGSQNTQSLAIASILYYVLIVFDPVFLFYILQKQNPFAALGLTGKALKNIGVGLLIGGGVLALFYAINRFVLANQDPPQVNALFLAGTVLAGVLEEIPFRGLMLPHYSARMGFWRANILVSVLFVALHAAGWLISGSVALAPALLLFVISLWLGYLRHKTKSLWPPIVVHALYNLAVYVF